MKKLLALVPCLTLAACGGAADITTEEPFQITCTWTRGEKSGDETWFVDPKLDVAVQESEAGEKVQELKYDIQKVTPRKIVIGGNWWQEVKEDGSYSDWYRDEISIDRSTGELAFKRFSLSKSATSYPDLTAGWKGEEQELAFEYDCQEPTRK